MKPTLAVLLSKLPRHTGLYINGKGKWYVAEDKELFVAIIRDTPTKALRAFFDKGKK